MLIGLIKINVNCGGKMNNCEGAWLSIVDYSHYKKTSISTIRRHIKNNILKYKEENGKYFVFIPSPEKLKKNEDAEIFRMKLELEEIKISLKRLKEENNELKMLVELYEQRGDAKTLESDLIPDLPELP